MRREALFRRIERLPKVEIHLHLEGCVSRRRLRDLWDRPGRDPSLPSDPGVVFRHRDFPDFLAHFGMIARAIRTPGDFGAITRDLGAFLGRQGIVAAEVFLSPVGFVRRGLDFGEMFGAIEEAAAGVARGGGPSLRFLLDAVRQWGPPAFETLLDCARAARGRVLGVGLGGDESSVPAREFADLFAEARRMGLRTVAHAGEFAPAQSIREAVEILGAERIGHGIRALEDQDVVRLLKRRKIPLEVCPTSNLRTGVIRRWREHPLPEMVRSRLRVTLNSDDPAMFGTSLRAEYAAARNRLGLSAPALYRIAREGISASFLPPEERRRLLRLSRRVWIGKAGIKPVRTGFPGGPRAQGRA